MSGVNQNFFRLLLAIAILCGSLLAEDAGGGGGAGAGGSANPSHNGGEQSGGENAGGDQKSTGEKVDDLGKKTDADLKSPEGQAEVAKLEKEFTDKMNDPNTPQAEKDKLQQELGQKLKDLRTRAGADTSTANKADLPNGDLKPGTVDANAGKNGPTDTAGKISQDVRQSSDSQNAYVKAWGNLATAVTTSFKEAFTGAPQGQTSSGVLRGPTSQSAAIDRGGSGGASNPVATVSNAGAPKGDAPAGGAAQQSQNPAAFVAPGPVTPIEVLGSAVVGVAKTAATAILAGSFFASTSAPAVSEQNGTNNFVVQNGGRSTSGVSAGDGAAVAEAPAARAIASYTNPNPIELPSQGSSAGASSNSGVSGASSSNNSSSASAAFTVTQSSSPETSNDTPSSNRSTDNVSFKVADVGNRNDDTAPSAKGVAPTSGGTYAADASARNASDTVVQTIANEIAVANGANPDTDNRPVAKDLFKGATSLASTAALVFNKANEFGALRAMSSTVIRGVTSSMAFKVANSSTPEPAAAAPPASSGALGSIMGMK